MLKQVAVCIALVGLLQAGLFDLRSGRVTEAEKQFQKFIVKFDKEYASIEEYLHRLSIFEANLRRFEEHNANPKTTFTMGITPFADLLPEEFPEAKALSLPKNAQQIKSKPRGTLEVASSSKFNELKSKFGVEVENTIDWTKLGVVPQVTNQGQMGQSTNHMIAHSMDSAKAIRDQTTLQTRYSVAELDDCTEDMQSALEFTVSKGLEDIQEYQRTQTSCEYDPTKPHLNVKEWDLIEHGQSATMVTRLHGQPLLTLMDASSGAFMYYTGGVLTDGCVGEAVLNHSLMMVGYDEDSKVWKAQNSWGEQWGEQGYVRLSAGVDLCGIESYPLVPVLY